MTTELAAGAAGVATVTTGVVVNDETLVPMGIVVAAVIAIGCAVWKIAREHFQIKLQIKQNSDRIEKVANHADSLERLYGSRYSRKSET